MTYASIKISYLLHPLASCPMLELQNSTRIYIYICLHTENYGFITKRVLRSVRKIFEYRVPTNTSIRFIDGYTFLPMPRPRLLCSVTDSMLLNFHFFFFVSRLEISLLFIPTFVYYVLLYNIYIGIYIINTNYNYYILA